MPADSTRRIAALAAKIAELRGEDLPKNGKADISWYEQELVLQYLHSCPRSFYARIAGKQFKSLNDQHATYGVPTQAGENVDIVAVLKWFNDFLAEWGPRIKRRSITDEEKIDRKDRKEELELKQLEMKLQGLAADLEKKTGNTISVDELNRVFAWYEGELRRLGERLGKRFGAESQTLFNSTLTRMGKFLAESFGNESASD